MGHVAGERQFDPDDDCTCDCPAGHAPAAVGADVVASAVVVLPAQAVAVDVPGP